MLRLSLEKLKKLHVDLKMYSKEKISWWFKFKTRIFLGINKSFFDMDFISELYFHILNRKIDQTKLNLKIDEEYLKKHGKNQIEKLVRLSKEVLFTKIYKNNMLDEKINLNSQDFRKITKVKEFNKFIKKRPIVLSTIFSVMNTKNNSVLYDYLIIDEASQTDMLACIGAMACAKNIIVVGDLKQLPQVDNIIFKEYFDKNIFNIESGYEYYKNNILKSFLTIYKDKVPTQLLREHYRCHPGIIEFCNQKYYDNKLIIMTEEKEKTNPFETIVGESLYYNDTNKTSKKEIENIKNYLVNNNISDIGIITPFRNQANLLSSQVGSEKILADTIHRFQGQEKDNILFAVTKAKIEGRSDFVSNSQLINVAVSRAKNKFILAHAGNLEETPDNDVKDLLKYINYNYPKTLKNIAKNSEFYMLSKEFNSDLLEAIQEYNLTHSHGTSEPSEIIVHSILEEIIKEKSFSSLNITLFKKLSLLVPDAILSGKFEEKELKFLKHHWAHVDFLIYDKFNHAPILVIEVDGLSFHKKDKQIWRDRIKDKALQIQKIPIIRISTSIQEKIKPIIIKKLTEILN
ncbi:AAA domain-containing protein [Mesoplasma florum]|uniref:AAA domain-containing protein n=1 Tax=Mesoplasma florum TaxID=2151 RepID=UPI0012FD619B|nr:AAA domain-containing protein [Mesoplasma florum]